MRDYSAGGVIEGDFMKSNGRGEYLLQELWDWQESSKLAVKAGMFDDLFLQADETSRRLRGW